MATRVLVVVDENLPPSAVTVLQTVLPPIVDEIIAVAGSELQGASDEHLLEEIVRRLGVNRRGVIVTRDKRFERDARYTPGLPVDIVILQHPLSRGKKKSTRLNTRPRLLARIRSAVREVVKKAVA